MGTTRTPPCICPRCDYLMEAATEMDGGNRGPQPGDISACARCGLPLLFVKGGKVRAMERAELAELLEDMPPDVRAALFLAVGALGSNSNPLRRTQPGRQVAAVEWAAMPGSAGQALVVRSSGPADVGVAAVVLCQGIAQLPEFTPEVQAAARAMVAALTSHNPFSLPVVVHRSTGES
jgi:hypothetical protein